MANRRLPMSKIRETIRMSKYEISHRRISKALGISRQKIAEYLSCFKSSKLTCEDIEKLSDSELRKICSPAGSVKSNGRLKILQDKFSYFVKELKRKGVTKQLLWEEYLEENPEGYSHSQFCYHFQQWQKQDKLTMHIDHKAGDKMFVDYAGHKLSVFDLRTGKTREVETFLAVLGASGLTYVEASESQKKEDWIKSNENSLHYFGGVPQAIVPDCLKSAVTKADKYEPDINPEFADFARHYDTVILPARPYSPKDKSLVENAVSIIYTRIYAPLRNRTFFSIEQLNEAIREKLEEHNNKIMQKIKSSRRQLFEEIERHTLNPLPYLCYEFKNYKKMTCQLNYHVYLKNDNHYYSVPYRYKGKQVTLIYTSSNIEIFHDNKRIAFHKRDRTNHAYTTVRDHMPSSHGFVADWTPQRILNWASGTGENVRVICQKIINTRKHPEQAFKVCIGIINLSKKYSKFRVNNACRRANYFGAFSYKSIKGILEKGLDREQEDEAIPLFKNLPDHENIRGKKYYTGGIND
ncbi:MAG: IS21 family transposase [Candidatus Pacebacteria bacterium]|nr:IS21 family transposase [Candidatus Paceibacterota bacterium]